MPQPTVYSPEEIRIIEESFDLFSSAGIRNYAITLLMSRYLGHECLLDTDKYMRFSGAQMPDSLEAFETFSAGLIPSVEVPYEDE